MLSFEEKIAALASIRSIGLSKAVYIFSKMKRCPASTMREELGNLDSNHYLLDNGVVEKSITNVVQYIEFNFPQQPITITKEFLESCKKPQRDAIFEALTILRCTHVVEHSFRPASLQRKVRNARAEEIRTG